MSDSFGFEDVWGRTGYVVGAFEVPDKHARVRGVDAEGFVEEGFEVGACGGVVHGMRWFAGAEGLFRGFSSLAARQLARLL